MSPSAGEPSSLLEFFDGLDFFPIALVVAATIAPGMTICIPGLLFVTVLLLIPVVALLLVVGAVAAVVLAPFALVRGTRWLYGLLKQQLHPVMTKELSA